MIRLILLTLVLFPAALKADTDPGFKGCGEYLVKGIYTKIENQLIYKVNAGTVSEMRFSFSRPEDMSALGSYLEVPTVIKADILTPMDGTKGVLRSISSLSIRKPDPLNPLKDTGLFFQTNKPCL